MTKKIFAYATCVIWLLNPVIAIAEDLTGAVSPQKILITEIGAFEPAETEWVEIFNSDGAAIDLTGWKFFEDKTNHGISPARGDFLIESNEYAIIANKADAFMQKYSDFAGTVFDSSWGSLKEEGEEIGLKDSGGNFVELFTYPAVDSAAKDTSIERTVQENWTRNPISNSIGKKFEVTSIAPAAQPSETSAPPTSEPQILPTPTPQLSSPATIIPDPPSSFAPQPPANSPPQAIIQVQSGNLVAYGATTINFDGRASSDPEGDKLTFLWDLGDGGSSTSANPGLHKYDKPGDYIVTLSVTDSFGLQNTAHEYVHILAQPSGSPVGTSSLISSRTVTAPPPSPAPKTAKPTVVPTDLQIKELPDGSFEIHGYITFAPSDGVPTTSQKLIKLTSAPSKSATKKSTTKSTKTSTKTSTKKSKMAPKNGDLSADIKLTEIFPAPAADDSVGEWIELFNKGDNVVNLGNWMLADISKKDSPYLIPDTVLLKPGEYKTFPKSDTKISLNNTSDQIFLADFNGDIVDSASYEGTEKGLSYALTTISSTESLLANAGTALAKSADEKSWEWTDEKTPGVANPVLEKIEGTVSNLNSDGENSFEVTTANGTRKIKFSEDKLNPLMAQVTMGDGTTVSLKAKKEAGNDYELKTIDKVQSATSKPVEEKSPLVMWSIISLLTLSIFLNAPPLLKKLKDKWRAYCESRRHL